VITVEEANPPKRLSRSWKACSLTGLYQPYFISDSERMESVLEGATS